MYDSLIVLALLIFSTALIIPFIKGHEIPPGNFIYQSYLLTIIFSFFGWFWIHRGQTLGMMAWRLKIRTDDGYRLTWKDALVRFLLAIPSLLCFGIGLLWILFDKESRALHDRLSKTEVFLSRRS